MDFSFSEEQDAIRELAGRILDDTVTLDRLKQVEASDDRIDRRAWDELGKAGLLALPFGDDVGGSGLGFLEIALVLEQVGRTVAPVPVLPSVVLGGLAIEAFGTPEQRQAILPDVASGSSIITAALVEQLTDPVHPTTTARRDGDGWVLDGVKSCVPAGMAADRMLVPAATGEGAVGVFVVDATAAGLTRLAEETTNHQIEARVELVGVRAAAGDVLGDPAGGAAIVEWIAERATAALCVVASAVCERALRITAEYTKTREQFERPIATFQAVGQRAADAYIDTEAVRLTAWQAAWRLHEGLPAAAEVAIAKFWAAEGGQRVVHAAQHLHGGIGVDRDYPVHRYFLWAKHLELTLGGATQQLLKLGRILADEPV